MTPKQIAEQLVNPNHRYKAHEVIGLIITAIKRDREQGLNIIRPDKARRIVAAC